MKKRSRRTVTFIVRASRAPDGLLRGVVERVRTGAKERFTGSDTLGGVIETMLGPIDKTRRSQCPRASTS